MAILKVVAGGGDGYGLEVGIALWHRFHLLVLESQLDLECRVQTGVVVHEQRMIKVVEALGDDEDAIRWERCRWVDVVLG